MQVSLGIGILKSVMDNNIYAVSYKMRKELYHKIFSIVLFAVLVVLFISLFMNFILYPVYSKSDSMAPDIPSNSFEFITPLLKKPSRGDVVLVQNYDKEKISLSKKIANSVCMFFSARQWMPFDSNRSEGTGPVIRRVIGLPGDTIYIDRYVVFIKSIEDSHFLTEFEIIKKKYNVQVLVPPAGWDVELGAKSTVKKITLGPDEYFVLGDKRISSTDSRVWGPVKQSKIKGKVLMLYFPFSRFKIF